MICICPTCSIELQRPLHDGIVYCAKCNHIIKASMKNKLLSLFRYIEENNVLDVNKIKFQTQTDEDEILFVLCFMQEHNYSFEDFKKTITKFFG
jgi:hypothetical protein